MQHNECKDQARVITVGHYTGWR